MKNHNTRLFDLEQHLNVHVAKHMKASEEKQKRMRKQMEEEKARRARSLLKQGLTTEDEPDEAENQGSEEQDGAE